MLQLINSNNYTSVQVIIWFSFHLVIQRCILRVTLRVAITGDWVTIVVKLHFCVVWLLRCWFRADTAAWSPFWVNRLVWVLSLAGSSSTCTGTSNWCINILCKNKNKEEGKLKHQNKLIFLNKNKNYNLNISTYYIIYTYKEFHVIQVQILEKRRQ